jgi:hypothetical protein
MMKMKFFVLPVVMLFGTQDVSAQTPLIGPGSAKPDTARKSVQERILQDPFGGKALAASLTDDELVSGLKEALTVGAQKSAEKLSARDGFFGNAAIKLFLPPEAVKVEQKLRGIGLGKQVDQVVLSINRAAEDAAGSAAPIFIRAIREMSFRDAKGILKGGDSAATEYLREKTAAELTAAFRPVIEKSLSGTDATRYWNGLFSTYNRFSKEKVEPDLAGYVTEKALQGIFYQLGEEERRIRKDPVARTSELLKKVFSMK